MLGAGILALSLGNGPVRAQDNPYRFPETQVDRSSLGAPSMPPGGDARYSSQSQPLPAPSPAVPPPKDDHCAPPQSFWGRIGYKLRACFIGFPEEWNTPALGATNYPNFKAQVSNGEAAQMVLYQFDFANGGANLSVRGKDQLAKMAALLPKTFHPIVIERIPAAPALAEARREAVLKELAQYPFPVPRERVVIGRPIAYGLSGVEAEVVYGNLLNQVQTGPQGGSQGGSSTPVNSGPATTGAGSAAGGASSIGASPR
jgi:hypothetical protein